MLKTVITIESAVYTGTVYLNPAKYYPTLEATNSAKFSNFLFLLENKIAYSNTDRWSLCTTIYVKNCDHNSIYRLHRLGQSKICQILPNFGG